MKPTSALRSFLALTGSLFLAAQMAQAVPLYWDIDGATAGSGGATPSGTWSTGGTTWSTDSTGTTATSAVTTTAFDDLFFSAGTDATGAYAIGLNTSTQNARLVTFEDGTGTLNTGTLSLGNLGGITVTSGTVTGATISSGLTITGAQTFNIAASRTLTLDTGSFTRNAGATLNVLSTGTVATTMTGLDSASMVNGIIGPWASFGSGASTRYATIDGSNNIVGFTGTSSTVAAIGNTPTVNYEVSAVGTLGSGANINTLRYHTGAGGTIAGALTSNGIMNVSGNALTFSGAFTGGAGGTVINAANGGISFSSSVNNGGGMLIFDGPGATSIGNTVLTGAGGLTKSGTGTLSLNYGASNNPTYGGPTILNGGILRLGGGGSGNNLSGLPTGNITVNGGVFDVYWGNSFTRNLGSGTSQIQILGGVSGFSQLASTQTLSIKLNNNNTPIVWGSDFFKPATLVLNSVNGFGTVDFQNFVNFNGANRTVEVNAGVGQMSGGLSTSGTAGLIKTGNGILSLTNTNTYNGGTTVNGGTLAFGAIASMPSAGVVALANNTAIGINLGGTGNWSTGTSGAGTLGGLIGGTGGVATNSFTYTGSVGLRLNVLADSTYSGVIPNLDTGATTLTKVGANVLTLTNTNTFTGAMNLNAGTLRLENINAIGSASALNALTGTTLQLRSDTAATFATPLTTLNSIGGENLTINVDRISSGSGNQLVLNGGLSSQQNNGNDITLNFTGGNGYTLSIPTFKMDRFGAGGGGATHLLNPTTTSVAIGPVTSSATQTLLLRLGGTSTGNTLGAITHTSAALSLRKESTSTWRLTGSSNYTGATTIQAGTLLIGAAAPSGSSGALGNATSAVVLGNNSTAATNAPSLLIDGPYTVARAITVGSVANTAAYNATIGGSNTTGTSSFTGNITLNTTAANYTATLRAATGGTVQFGTGTWTTNNKAIAIGSSGNTGTVRLNNAIATSGGINVNFGTLELNSAYTGGAMTVASGATLSGTGSVAGLTTVLGTHSPGNSPGVITHGDLAYDGGSSTVVWELVANSSTQTSPTAIFDQIIINGDLDFADTTTINFAFNVSGSDVDWTAPFWENSQSWVLYDVSGTTTGFPGNLSINTFNWLDSSGTLDFDTALPDSSFSLSLSGQDVMINYTVIPEPSSALLVGLSSLLLFRRRR